MAEAKKKTITQDSGIVSQLDLLVKQMAEEAEESTGDDWKDAVRRQCVSKLDAVAKFIQARW